MKKIILLLSAVLLWALPVSVSAQNKNNDKVKQQRKEQFDRFCKFRRDFMMKQIGLSEQEAKQFFPLYEEMEGIMKKGRSFFDLLPFFLFMVQISFPKNRLYEGYTIRYSIRVLSIRFGFRARHLFYRSIL